MRGWLKRSSLKNHQKGTPRMNRMSRNGVELEYEVTGEGEPVLLIHGSILGDGFLPLLSEPALTDHYQVITYHRSGFLGSARAKEPFTIAQQVADGRALLQHLGLHRVHIVGHSFGAVITMQWALDVPDEVQSLTLLEPPLLGAIPSGPAFWEGMAAMQALYASGDKVGAADAFCSTVIGPDYRELAERTQPPGSIESAFADIDTFFQVEIPALRDWQMTAADAARIQAPVLAMVGGESGPIFYEVQAALESWFPQAETLVVPQAAHSMPLMNPRAVAEGLVHFLAKHPF